MRSRHGRWCLVAVIAVVALIAVACDSGDDTGDNESETEQPGVELTGDPVRLMVIFEGTAGVAQPNQSKGALAAADAINRGGGIDGRPVEIIECDTANDPNTAAECGRRAVSEDVVAVVGAFSIHSGEFMPLLVDNQIPSIALNPATTADFTSEASFPITGGAVATFGTLPVALAEEGAEEIALARVDLDAAAALAGFGDTALARFDMSLVRDVPIPNGTPDMAPFVAAALSDGTDAIVVGLAGQDATNFTITAKQTDPDVKIGLIATELDEAVEALGEVATGLILSQVFYSDQIAPEAVGQCEDDMEAAGFEGGCSLSYGGVKVVEALAAELPQLTHEALWEKLPTATDVDIGFLPPLQFVEAAPGQPIPRIFNACEAAVRLVVDGDDFETEPVTDTLINPFTGEECPNPPSTG